jgi:hypothetical protein
MQNNSVYSKKKNTIIANINKTISPTTDNLLSFKSRFLSPHHLISKDFKYAMNLNNLE